jgi:hypothetical protein
MSQAFFAINGELKVERNNNRGSRFEVSLLGLSGKGETLESALTKLAIRIKL